jgi:hypothetical protein
MIKLAIHQEYFLLIHSELNLMDTLWVCSYELIMVKTCWKCYQE